MRTFYHSRTGEAWYELSTAGNYVLCKNEKGRTHAFKASALIGQGQLVGLPAPDPVWAELQRRESRRLNLSVSSLPLFQEAQ